MIFMLSKSSNDRVDSVAVQRFLPIVRESSAGCLETATSFKFPKLMTDSFWSNATSKLLFKMCILLTFWGDLISCRHMNFFKSQYLIGPFTSVENKCRLETAKAEMGVLCPSRVWCNSNVTLSQTLMVQSVEPENMCKSFNANDLTDPWWPVRMCKHLQDFASQIRIFLSNDPETTWHPATARHKTTPAWPTNSDTEPVSRSKDLMALLRKESLSPEAATCVWAKNILFSTTTMLMGVPKPSFKVVSSTRLRNRMKSVMGFTSLPSTLICEHSLSKYLLLLVWSVTKCQTQRLTSEILPSISCRASLPPQRHFEPIFCEIWAQEAFATIGREFRRDTYFIHKEAATSGFATNSWMADAIMILVAKILSFNSFTTPRATWAASLALLNSFLASPGSSFKIS